MTQDGPETYSLEQAADALGVSVVEIRLYVDEGLVTPRQDDAGQAVLGRTDMRRLWSAVTLHRDLGINLPGVAAVLRLREQFEQVRHDLEILVEIVERELGPGAWERLWPEGRPRPSANVCVEGFSDLNKAIPPPGEASRPTPGSDAGDDDSPKAEGTDT
ncbi:MAG TPA: chaperone modulator CbpM [Phycisphaerae bacterium]|nr:chaperone modulator CbpM [Phycisphaerae bacterium]